MSILEMVDANFLRDILNQSVLKLIRAANNLDRLLTQVAIMDEYAKAFRTRMWGGYLDSISHIASTSSIAGIYSEGGIDRYIIIKHILQPLLSDARFLRAGIGAIKSQTDKLTFDASNRLAIQNPPNLDVTLSTRASESTLSGIKTQTDKLTFDASNRLAIQNPPNLDVTLSTRLAEATFTGRFPSATTLADNLPNPTTTIVGVANLGWDGTYWRRLATDTSSRLRVSADVVANPSNLDVALSTRASESTLSGIKTQTDKLTFDASNRLAIQNPPNLDVALSTRLAEATFTGRWDGGIYGFDGTTARKIKTDSAGELQVDVLSTANPSNLDVALSTRASESSLSGFSGKFPSAVTLSDTLSNPTTTIVGAANLGWDGTYWRRLATDTSSRLRVSADVVANPSNLDVALSTRASESTLSGFSGKFPSAVALSDTLSNPTTTIVGCANLGWDGTYWRRVAVDSSSRFRVVAESVANPSNLDVALSTRATESTLSGLSGKFPSAVALSDSLSNPTTTIVGCASLGWDGTYWRRMAVDSSSRLRVVAESVANPSNLDVTLTVQAKLERWGRNVDPTWVHAAEVTAPAAGTALVTRSVSSGKTGYIYGFFISAGEANDFRINWTSGGTARSIRIPFSGKGAVHYADFIAINEGLGADAGTSITITNVNAGGSGVVYQARLLVAEL